MTVYGGNKQRSKIQVLLLIPCSCTAGSESKSVMCQRQKEIRSQRLCWLH